MKKVITILLLIAMTLTMTACGSKEEEKTQFAPIADYQQAYLDATPLTDSKLNYFQAQLVAGTDAYHVFWEYITSEACPHEFNRNSTGRIAFIEGKMIAKDEYVLVTQDMLVGFTPIAMHFRWEDNKMTMIDISLVTTNPNLEVEEDIESEVE